MKPVELHCCCGCEGFPINWKKGCPLRCEKVLWYSGWSFALSCWFLAREQTRLCSAPWWRPVSDKLIPTQKDHNGLTSAIVDMDAQVWWCLLMESFSFGINYSICHVVVVLWILFAVWECSDSVIWVVCAVHTGEKWSTINSLATVIWHPMENINIPAFDQAQVWH